MSPKHDLDAGGDASVLTAKAALRDEIWSSMRAAKVGRFPGTDGRIPNFVGAEAAAERLRVTSEWRHSATVKANPDMSQLPVRQRALEDGKRVYMATPRLATDPPFFLLDPESLSVRPREAASIKGATRLGRPVAVDALEPVDLAVVGSVAVSADGARLGKGGGFSDLEYALASEAGLVSATTVVATTVHELQVVDEGRIPITDHDVTLDLVVTAERVIDCSHRKRSPSAPRIRWAELTDEKIASIPLLARLRDRQ